MTHPLDEQKQCKECSHQRFHHKYSTREQNNDPKCEYSDCNCVRFIEWI
jgi:hypothetical protein